MIIMKFINFKDKRRGFTTNLTNLHPPSPFRTTADRQENEGL